MMKKTILILVTTFFSLFAMAQSDTLASQHPEYLPGIKAGEMAPQFSAPDTLGRKVSLSDFRGKYVVLDFWASWCGDCRREIPYLKTLYGDVKGLRIDGKSIAWIGMSFDTKEEQWKDLLRKSQMPWRQISSLRSTREDPTFKSYQLHWIPAFFLLGPDGKVIASAITADGLRQAINDLADKHKQTRKKSK